MEYIKPSKDEPAIENKLKDNYYYMSLGKYFSTKAPGGKFARVQFTHGISQVIAVMKYGKARIYINAYVEESGAVNTLVFDLREVFDKIVVNQENQDHGTDSDYEQWLYNVFKIAHFDKHNLCLFEDYQGGIIDDDEYFSAIGVCLIDYFDTTFNAFTPWASVVNKVLNALDTINGFEGKNKLNRLTKKDVDAAAISYPMIFWIVIALGFVAIIGGILLIALNSAWPAVVNWILGIIMILAGLFFGPMMIWTYKTDVKEYNTNSGDALKKAIKPSKHLFNTLG